MSVFPTTNQDQVEPLKRYWLTKGLRYMLTLALLGAMTGLVITVANHFTAPVIAVNQHNRLMDLLARMIPDADEFRLMTTDDDHSVYLGMKYGRVTGVILPAKSKGFYGEPVEILILVNTAGEIENVLIERHSETPGIGTKIEQPEFLSQFAGTGNHLLEDAEEALQEILLSKIDTISGATISSAAVITGVGKALEQYAAVSLRLDD